MKRFLPMIIAPVLLSLCGAAFGADEMVRMKAPAEVAPGVAAMPLIADPANDQQRKINAAVSRLDLAVRKAIAECAKGGKATDWSRSVTVTMNGPRFLSYRIHDDAFCGGAHPNTATMSIVYDLQSGQPVDWTKLLPPSLTGTLALNEGMDGTKMITLSSPLLHALYLTGYRPRGSERQTDPDDDDCRDAVADTDGRPPAMMAWLDAAEDGLAVQFDLVHAAQACTDTVVIPVEALKALGARPFLVNAITSAHAGAMSSAAASKTNDQH